MFGAALVLMRTPSGRWAFAGRVPAPLAWCRKDGRPMTAQDFEDAAASNTPALVGYRTVSFPSAEEARTAAAAIGAEITQETP